MNPLSSVLGAIGNQVRDIYLGKLARDIAEGKHGPKVQAIYLWSRGKEDHLATVEAGTHRYQLQVTLTAGSAKELPVEGDFIVSPRFAAA